MRKVTGGVVMTALAALNAYSTASAQVSVPAWPQVAVDLLLLNSKGDPVTEASPDSLLVKENGRPVAIDSLVKSAGPQSVCLLIDTSSSMRDRMALLHEAATRLLHNLPAEDEVCVATFDARLALAAKFTGDHATASASVPGEHSAGGGTASFNALIEMDQFMKTSANHKSRVLVLFADGDDNLSTKTLKDALHEFETEGSPVVHTVLIPSGSLRGRPTPDRLGQENRDSETMQQVAAATGGLSLQPETMTAVPGSIDQLASAMKARYTVAFRSPDAQRNGQERRLDIRPDKSRGGPKITVHAPMGYIAAH